MDTIKLKILALYGKNDLELYIKWKRKVDWIFDCHHYTKHKKIKLFVIKFTNYALI